MKKSVKFKLELKALGKNLVAFYKLVLPYTLLGTCIATLFTDPIESAHMFATIASNPSLLPQLSDEGEKELKMLDDQGIGMFE